MRTYIKVAPSLRLQIMKQFGITRKCVWENLNGLVVSPQGDQIRSFALANGGKMVLEAYIPNCSTIKQEEGFVHFFPAEVSVIVNTQASTAWIMKGDEVLHQYFDVTVNQLANILWKAEELSKDNLN